MELFSKQHIVFVIGIACASALGAGIAVWGVDASHRPLSNTAYLEPAFGGAGSCNVLALKLHGEIMTVRANIPLTDTVALSQSDGSTILSAPNYSVSGEMEDALAVAKADPSIKAVILDVDSPGGSGVAGEEIARALRSVGKPTAAVIHGMGASAGYMAALGADRIYASAQSDVGSIGVTSSYVDQVDKDRKDGYTYHALSSGQFKDTGSPDKPLTAAEESLIMRDIKIARDNFVQMVAEMRGLSLDKVNALADGSTMMGKQALDAGLIDQIGSLSDAEASIEDKIGEPVSLCWQ